MYEEIVTLGKLSLAILAYELFLGSGRPPGSSEQPGVVVGVEGGLEGGLAQPLPHQQGGADVGQQVLVGTAGAPGTGAGGREQAAGGQGERLSPRRVGLLLRGGQGGGGGGQAVPLLTSQLIVDPQCNVCGGG